MPAFRALPKPNYISRKRVDYLTRVIAILHAALVTVFAYYGCFIMCNIFSDPEFIVKPKNFHVLSTIVTIGYLTFDLLATGIFNHESGSALTY